MGALHDSLPATAARRAATPVAAEADYAHDFDKTPVTPQAEADRLLDTKPVADWSSTDALKVHYARSHADPAHPRARETRSKVTEWYRTTFPGTTELTGGHKAEGRAFASPEARRALDARIDRARGLRTADFRSDRDGGKDAGFQPSLARSAKNTY